VSPLLIAGLLQDSTGVSLLIIYPSVKTVVLELFVRIFFNWDYSADEISPIISKEF